MGIAGIGITPRKFFRLKKLCSQRTFLSPAYFFLSLATLALHLSEIFNKHCDGSMSDLGSNFDNKRGTAGAFGERLRARRDFLGFTQLDLVKKTGISLASIQSYEKGNIPKGDYLLVLSDLLTCSIDWLLKGTPETEITSSTPPPAAPAEAPPVEEIKISDMLTKTAEVLESDTIYRTALASNINAFHQAVSSERTLARLEERMAQLEQRVEGLANENAGLKRRLEQHEENNAKAVGQEG